MTSCIYKDFFTTKFEYCLLPNVKNVPKTAIKGIQCEIVFLNTLWRLWKRRNLAIFIGQNLSTNEVVMSSLSWSKVLMRVASES